VGEDHLRPGRDERGKPLEEITLSGVSTESTQGVYRSTDRDFLAVNRDRFGSLHESTAQRALALISDNEHMGSVPDKVLVEVMENPSSIAHACPRQDQAGTFDPIEVPGVP
jgi:hypothetical protein